ncbi:hypothetical protein [Erythrobacter litoralis]|uniref:5-bromo-4-chloroindolyl phosphate hydrolysis protein n=1 Tax=Erythrobacter litoralis (strain HTCC2594) TaxID=314225 RepID=Q2N7L7_ERYLH|nr:hypothetical protein [Erythrobacter litoralis]ABC64324.1 hypothetical protein ELI_11160 [Erythrobacter litoralis HTCC2594]
MSDEYKSYSRRSDRILEDARRVRDDNRKGGRHRRQHSIGTHSARAKRKNLVTRAKYFAMAVIGILAAASVAGLVVNGIGFTGVIMAALGVLVSAYIFGSYPKVKTPQRADLKVSDPERLVTRTEMWLEEQQRFLPRSANRVIEQLGDRLDNLSYQLQRVPAEHETARDIRKLVGETLPDMVDSYKNIPRHLQREKRGETSPEEQITEGLQKISNEIDHITRKLAQGSIDDLAIKHRYLDYKYGEGVEGEQADYGVPLPDFDKEKTASR